MIKLFPSAAARPAERQSIRALQIPARIRLLRGKRIGLHLRLCALGLRSHPMRRGWLRRHQVTEQETEETQDSTRGTEI